MSSNLRVNSIVPASGTNVAIGTVGGTITYNANVSGVTTFSSGVVVAAGTTAAPSISPSGDSNTGIFFPDADTVCIGEGGVEVIRVNSSGFVGINTNNPSKLVEVGAANTTSKFQLNPHNAGWDLAATSGNIAPHYQTNISLYSGQIGTGTLRWQINNSGAATIPSQPSFRATLAATVTSTFTGESLLTLTNVEHNAGNYYNSGTGRFTAPVNGYYSINMGIVATNAITAGFLVVESRVNGTVNYNKFTASSSVSGSESGTNASSIIYLNANDYVQMNVYSPNSITIGSSGSFGWQHGRTYFAMHLLS